MIVADDKIPFLKGILEPFTKVEYLPGNEITKSQLTQAKGLIIRTRTKCNKALLEDTPIKFIGTATIGYDHIDTNYCSHSNIHWTNAPGCNSGSVAQYMASVFAHLHLCHNLNLEKLTIGIVGAGNVGSKVARVANAFGLNVMINDPPRERAEGKKGFVSLNYIAKHADIISFHVPLNRGGLDNSFHLANSDFFSILQKTPVIINSSRGEVLNEEALKNALNKKLVSKFILDVWENEPCIDIELLERATLATPHIAGYSVDGKANGTAMIVNALCDFMNFPLKRWYPENVPAPINELSISLKGSDQDNLSRIILQTYDVARDDKNLRENPHNFEMLRGKYPPRREFQAYSFPSNGINDSLLSKLKNMNFNINKY